MWDLPGPGLEPVSPALAGGFLTTAPPGKPGVFYVLLQQTRTCFKSGGEGSLGKGGMTVGVSFPRR